MNEIWTQYPGFPDYYVSNTGKVKSFKHKKKYPQGRILKGGLDASGYMIVILCDPKGKRKTAKVHRLVAELYCPNPKPDQWNIVNHKDENKLNNNCENLEWCSQYYNSTYGTSNERGLRTLRDRNSRFGGRDVVASKGNVSQIFPSITSAGKTLNIDTSYLRKTILKNKPAKGWTVRFLNGNHEYID